MDKKKILVIDDSKTERYRLLKYLRSIPQYEVDEADSGSKALNMMKEKDYDIILSDLNMKDIGGLEVLKKGKKLQPNHTDMVIITAYATIDSVIDAMKHGAYDYIQKPVNLEELGLLIERCLEKQNLVAEVAGLKEIVNLYQVSEGLNSLMDLDQLLSLITKLAVDTLDADGGSIMLMNEEEGTLIVEDSVGSRKKDVLGKKVNLGDRISGYAAEKGEKIRVDGSVKDDKRFKHLEEYAKICSGITVPLQRKDKVLGVINLNRTLKDDNFTEDDVKLLSIFATQAAMAIENVSLFNNLKQEKEILNTIFNEVGDGALLLDNDLNIVVINRSLTGNFLGMDRKTCLGMNLEKCFKDFEPSIPWRKIKHKKNDTISFDLIRTKGKLLILTVFLNRITDDQDNVSNYVMVLRDRTHERQQELAKKNFLNLMSHKLRTPLTSIISFTSLLKKDKGLDKSGKSGKEHINIIEEKAKKLSYLVDKLLRLTMLDTEALLLNKTEENPKDMVENVINTMGEKIKDDNVSLKISENFRKLPNIHVDKEKVEEVIENLIENAIKFNPKKKKKVEIGGKMMGDKFVILNISDNGPGIPPEERERIFEKFQQIEKHFSGQVEGLGLGLPMAKRIIESHRGNIWLESEMGKGSNFMFNLPINSH